MSKSITLHKYFGYSLIIFTLLILVAIFIINLILYFNTTNNAVQECNSPSYKCNNVNNSGEIIQCPRCDTGDTAVGKPEYEEQPTTCLIRKADKLENHIARIGYGYMTFGIFFLLYIILFICLFITKQ
jgi:hypothetical protein